MPFKKSPNRRHQLIKGHPQVRRHLTIFDKFRLRLGQRKAQFSLKSKAAILRNRRRLAQRNRRKNF